MSNQNGSQSLKYEISDKRPQKDFVGYSFSKFSKAKVKKELIKCCKECKIEPACYWVAELICAGHYLDIWDCIITCVAKHIHIGNPKLSIYIEKKYDDFREIMFLGYQDNEIKARNNRKIRALFTEIICILCFSRKQHEFTNIKIDETHFNMTTLTETGFLEASSMEFAMPYFKKDDPTELFIAMNEYKYSVEKTSNDHKACYWIEWILEFLSVCRKKKTPCLCERREFAPVDMSLSDDPIWILWEIILDLSEKKGKIIEMINTSLLRMFCIRYTNATKKRRKFILYFATSLLTAPFPSNIPLFENKEKIKVIVDRCDDIYKQIKENEIKPDTDYLFNGLESSNLEATIAKLDAMNSFSFIPRS